ncbi:MAG: S-layer homology domain-containing protein [Synergistaceae bacterium]|jgi:hypothetical protein|nr:S-layer homology domain-containing protein [Synergistaceae bacterium]
MKKLYAAVWFLALTALSGAVFAPQAEGAGAVVNPFSDLPAGHWAYDAVSGLAARGVLSGFPGTGPTYKGGRPATRYEVASALARALALVDLESASVADVETLKRLVAEFSDELGALGVKASLLDKRVAATEERLDGWKIFGEMRLDAEKWNDDAPNNGNQIFLSRARLELQREFDGILFYARLEDDGDGKEFNVYFDEFYAEVPFFYDTTLTVGRFAKNMEEDYRFATGGASDMAAEAWFSDNTVDGIAISKTLATGVFDLYAARVSDFPSPSPNDSEDDLSAWEVFVSAKFQFSERFGLDFGAQGVFGDDRSAVATDVGEFKTNRILTPFVGVRVGFAPDMTFKALYYYQKGSFEAGEAGENGEAWEAGEAGENGDYDTEASAYNLIVDVHQDALKFTSLWLEYSRVNSDFYLACGNTALMPGGPWEVVDGGFIGRHMGEPREDVEIKRAGALQTWGDQWSTWLYAAEHTWTDSEGKMTQLGVGAEYIYTPSVTFALSYITVDWNSRAESSGHVDEHRLQFRTVVTF